MKVVRLSDDSVFTESCVATIGFFDGVHRGHRYLIRQVIEVARRSDVCSTVITFDCHPRTVVKTSYKPSLLSTFDEKMQLLATTGIDRCVVLHFDEAMASLSAHDFMEKVLHDRLHVKSLVIGYDNRFGHDRLDGFEAYVAYGREMGIGVDCAKPFVLNGINVSSSVIRSFLQEGEMRMASSCLGYDYTLEGVIVSGEHIGTKIGFPTANLQLADPDKLVPAHGVYAVWARVGDDPHPWPAMLNIGSRPTFAGKNITIEVHLLHFDADIYGESLSIAFISKLRDEHKFRTVAELVNQLRRDALATELILTTEERKNKDNEE